MAKKREKKEKDPKKPVAQKEEKVFQVATAKSAKRHMEENLSKEMIESRMLELLSSRGKKGSKPKELIASMRALSNRAHAFGVVYELPVLMLLISMQFDTQRKIDSHMNLKS